MGSCARVKMTLAGDVRLGYSSADCSPARSASASPTAQVKERLPIAGTVSHGDEGSP